MGKRKKQLKDGEKEIPIEDAVDEDHAADIDVKPPKKLKTMKKEMPSMKKSKKKKAPTTDPLVSSKYNSPEPVRLASLQSMFATKDQEDARFTLFGGELVSESPTPQAQPFSAMQSSSISASSGTTNYRKPLYFFPHFAFPDKLGQSLFDELDEPFFHNKTEYDQVLQRLTSSQEKRQIWEERRYDWTQDWKKKRKAAMKLKRRVQIRRRL